jgi:hypothetical protein
LPCLLPVGDADLEPLEASELLVRLRIVTGQVEDVHCLGAAVERHDVRREPALENRAALVGTARAREVVHVPEIEEMSFG